MNSGVETFRPKLWIGRVAAVGLGGYALVVGREWYDVLEAVLFGFAAGHAVVLYLWSRWYNARVEQAGERLTTFYYNQPEVLYRLRPIAGFGAAVAGTCLATGLGIALLAEVLFTNGITKAWWSDLVFYCGIWAGFPLVEFWINRRIRYLDHWAAQDVNRPSARTELLTMTDPEAREIFLCHASDDKAAVIVPLAEALEREQISYFLDSKEILWGDGVASVINHALGQARFVLVVVSDRSLAKHWPQKEMNAALAREISEGTTRVLPLLVASDPAARQALWKRLALQGDKRYLEWTGDVTAIVEELKRLLARG